MTQSIMIQVGQCGNQIGCRFWDQCLHEHAFYSKNGIYDDAISSFFRNTETYSDETYDLPMRTGSNKINKLKARAILVDMEEGVINELLQGQLGEIFDSKQLITNSFGSGNNWAVGNKEYGTMYREQIAEQVRKAAELCDCLQCFFVLHSTGGGTGSGLGTSLLSILQDEFPEVYRFVGAVYPSSDDDVITSPYNSMLATYELTEKADCVLPINNQALINICNKVQQAVRSGKFEKPTEKNAKPFDAMNNLVANVILNMTSSSRFEGSLNVDLNEIVMNLVPFPKQHYLVSSLSPLYISKDVALPPRKLDQAFEDLFSKDHQLMLSDPRHSLYLACALMVRGKNVQTSDLNRNIAKLSRNLSFVNWNQEGWKTGLCKWVQQLIIFNTFLLQQFVLQWICF
uniref:Tubulin epsilon chain-like n=1 Tax=Phallusia mammillata TaxID=59560 RepID=A0A6F9DWH5_9ASCI|nr:tubulin epsilon chain-like [Phallusia mammillata]